MSSARRIEAIGLMVRSARRARLEPWAAPSFETAAPQLPQDGGARLPPHARPHFLRKQIVRRKPCRGDALLVRKAAEGVERLAVCFQPVRKRIAAAGLGGL